MSPTFYIVVLSGVVLVLQKSTSCKSSKIMLQESSLIVALIPQAVHLLWSWAGRPLKISVIMSLEQWSSSRSMIWLHNNLCNLFTRNSACSFRSLRDTEADLRLPKKNSAIGQKCFSFRGAKLLNSLPPESKAVSSQNGFKKSLKG